MWGGYHSKECKIGKPDLTCTDGCHDRQDELMAEWVANHPATAAVELTNLQHTARRFSELYLQSSNTLHRHSMFAYPHFWLWHALFDGTRLCRCWRSREMRDTR